MVTISINILFFITLIKIVIIISSTIRINGDVTHLKENDHDESHSLWRRRTSGSIDELPETSSLGEWTKPGGDRKFKRLNDG